MAPNVCHCATIRASMEPARVQKHVNASQVGEGQHATFPAQMANGGSPATETAPARMALGVTL